MNFRETLDHYRKIIDRELEQFFNRINVDNAFLRTNYNFVKEYIDHGKRLRPILLIMAYKAFHADEKIIPAALSVELLHYNVNKPKIRRAQGLEQGLADL